MTTDAGWEGVWEPNVLPEQILRALKDHAGSAQYGTNGKAYEWCTVNLRTGEFRYPSRGG